MDQVTNRFTLLTLFYDGGGWMYPLLLCSLFAMGVIMAKAYALWVANRRSSAILEEVETLIRAGNVNEAVARCEATPGPVAAILLAGLRRVQEGNYRSNDVEHAVKSTGTIELGFLERGLPILATVSNVAPLLGFLGTVAGMISAFAAIEMAGQVEATLVASGIKVALITTAAGLLIAVPVNVAYNFFVTRIDKMILDMEQGAARIQALLWELSDRRAAAQV